MSSTRQTVGSTLTPKLIEEINALQKSGERKHELWTRIVRNYIDAWKSGEIPRTYIGAGGANGTTFQVEASTFAELEEIAKTDGVSNAMAVRTAAAYFVYGASANDPWGTDQIMPGERGHSRRA